MQLLVLLLLAVVFVVLATTRLKLHPFLALLIAAFGYGIGCQKLPLADVVKAINFGFGDTIGKIGIVILAGSVIGTFLAIVGAVIGFVMKGSPIPIAVFTLGILVLKLLFG